MNTGYRGCERGLKDWEREDGNTGKSNQVRGGREIQRKRYCRRQTLDSTWSLKRCFGETPATRCGFLPGVP